MVTAGLFFAITFLFAAPVGAEYCPPQCRGEWTHVPGETVGELYHQSEVDIALFGGFASCVDGGGIG